MVRAVKPAKTLPALKVDGRVSRAKRQRESRRTAVLAVARRIFSQKGYHDTSIDDLIEEAGIARGTFYLYFESKRAIFDELLDQLFVTLTASVQRIDVSPGAAPPIEQMNATVDRVFKTLEEHREVARLLLREAVGIDADVDVKLQEFYGRIEALLVSAVSTGIHMGLVRPCDATLVARCILGASKEVVHFAFVERDPDKVDVRHLGRELIAFTLKGVFKSA
jgi:AcrR family transcriptional regulator